MASNGMTGSNANVVVINDPGGVTVVEPSTPLKRLNYFDGKFLRASDFDVEQTYLRRLVAISNQGLGPGVVYGYDTTLGQGDTIQIGPGLAIDPSGHVLLLQSTVTQSIQALIDASRRVAAQPPDASGKTGSGAFNDCVEIAAPPPAVVVPVSDIYVIAICTAEAFCGQQDVYGKLCEEACVTSTDRPYRLEGVVLRAIPLQLVTPFPTSKAVAIDSNIFLRWKVAESWFADEVRKHPNAVSRAGLLSDTWCLGAGYNSACCEVPLAVVARAGATTVFLDAWTVRRERIDAPSKRYWQWKMRMRPWDVFLGQVLQFQCQLADVLSGIVTPGDRAANPCASQHVALDEAVKFVDDVRSGLVSYRRQPEIATLDRPALLSMSLTHITDLRDRLSSLLKSTTTAAQPTDQIAIVEGVGGMSSAGYLPVLNGTSISVNDQVRALLGDGLDLRFCITTVDYIAHAFEEAQHMDRISLLQGLDDPSNKPKVDILVPDGKATGANASTAGVYAAGLRFSAKETGGLSYKGAAREEKLDSGGATLYAATAGISEDTIAKFQALARAAVTGKAKAKPIEFQGNLASNTFISKPKTTSAAVDKLILDTSATARTFVNLAGSAAALREVGMVNVARPAAQTTVDGLWLTARADKDVRSLAVKAQTPVQFRAVLGTRPSSPLAFELMFHGAFAVTTVSTLMGATVVSGTLNGTLSVGIYEEDQSLQKTIEYLMTERFNWLARFTFSGDSVNGSVVLDLSTPAGAFGPLQLTRTVSNQDRVAYTAGVVSNAAGAAPGPVIAIAELDLVSDSSVLDVTNANHRAAEAALDIVQAALIVSEPDLKQQAELSLFPPVPATTELRIEAVRDWVMFTRRRHKECAAGVAPVAPPLPPRAFRVIDLKANSREEADKLVTTLAPQLKDPVKASAVIRQLLVADDRRKNKLIVQFEGGTATPLSDLGLAKDDWNHFNPTPGKKVVFGAVGAAGDTDAGLQINRIHTFEAAISAATPTEVAIVPYPQDAVPPDADGVMLFISVSPVEVVVEHQHVFAANVDIFKLFLDAVGHNSLPDMKKRLAQATDLRLADYSVNDAGAVLVNDASVLSTFTGALPGHRVGQSIVLAAKGTSAADVGHQVEAAKKIVTDLSGDTNHLIQKVLGTALPVADADSIVVLELLG